MSGAERPGYLEAKVNHEIFDGNKPKRLKLADPRPKLLVFFAGRNRVFRGFIESLRK